MKTSLRLMKTVYKPKKAPEQGREVRISEPAFSMTAGNGWRPHVAKQKWEHQNINEKTNEPATKREGRGDMEPDGPSLAASPRWHADVDANDHHAPRRLPLSHTPTRRQDVWTQREQTLPLSKVQVETRGLTREINRRHQGRSNHHSPVRSWSERGQGLLPIARRPRGNWWVPGPSSSKEDQTIFLNWGALGEELAVIRLSCRSNLIDRSFSFTSRVTRASNFLAEMPSLSCGGRMWQVRGLGGSTAVG